MKHSTKNYLSKNTQGFTMIELMLAIGIFAVLAVFTTLNFIRPQLSTGLSAYNDLLVSDIKSQQMAAMLGVGNSTQGLAQGIYFESNRYILFSGSSYNPLDPLNLEVSLPAGTTFSQINLPNSTILFEPLSGEVENFLSGQNSIRIQNADSNFVDISFNEYGTLDL